MANYSQLNHYPAENGGFFIASLSFERARSIGFFKLSNLALQSDPRIESQRLSEFR